MLKPDKTGNKDTVTRKIFRELSQFVQTRSCDPSPDDRLVDFMATDMLGSEGICILNMDTRNLSDIPVARGDGQDFSPDGSRFLITASNANYVVRVTPHGHPCSDAS
jgi:hypothetical protein